VEVVLVTPLVLHVPLKVLQVVIQFLQLSLQQVVAEVMALEGSLEEMAVLVAEAIVEVREHLMQVVQVTHLQ
jgi:DNA anti-recombination protein RmuC